MITTSVNWQEQKLSLSEHEKKLIKNITEKLIRKYGEQCMVMVRNIGKMIKSISTRFIGVEMSISSAITKSCLIEIFEPVYSRRACSGVGPDVPIEVTGLVMMLKAE